jgi:YesN/AraC family two-component response regulator
MIKHQHVSINEACYAVGINNLSYFFKLFKRIEGKTPGESRRDFS